MEDWEIKNRLEDGIREICTRYLPGGRFDGRYYRAGGVHGGKGDSVVVHLDGDKKGKFFENAPKGDETFTSGNALDLIMAACNLSDYKDGINEAAKFLAV